MKNSAHLVHTSPHSISAAEMANAIRFLSMDAVEKANSGHPGMPMGFADVATVLFSKFLKFDPTTPDWPDRDRFVLSAGHGSMLLYSLLYLTGYEDMTLDEIKSFRQLHHKTAGHPERGEAGGIETTTGPLGQGLANAVGMALAERLMNARFGDDLVNHYTYCVAGDGCLMEGISHEAISLAGHLRLNKLIVLFDDNSISIDGATSLSVSDDQLARFSASGWNTVRVDGHAPDEIEAALNTARQSDRPTLIACRTTIGFGSPKKAGTASSHGSPLGKDEIAGAREKLGWPHAPFEVPPMIIHAWRNVGQKGVKDHHEWAQRVKKSPHREAFERLANRTLGTDWETALQDFIAQQIAAPEKIATRAASGKVLDVLVPHLPHLIGGSADLTGSNNTKAKTAKVVTRDDFSGNYIHYGVREHGMAAAMNGLALHGEFIPFGGTFLVFTDYCRPSIRLSALMHQPVIYIMTHDSIGLGEDGPTHQPVEHLSALRVIPHLLVFRPADVVETAECWALALTHTKNPSVLSLTRQNLPAVRVSASADNLSARGAYVLRDSKNPRAVLMATGSEVHLAVQAHDHLAAAGIETRVVSCPSLELFAQQTDAYRQTVLGKGIPRVAVEAGVRQSWDRYLGEDDTFIGMTSFGASGAYEKLYAHFGITTDAIVAAVKKRL